MLKVLDINEGLSRGRTSPADIADCLAGQVEQGLVRDCVLIIESPEDDLMLLNSDTNLTTHSDIYGFVLWALSTWANRIQHDITNRDEGG